MSGRAAWSPAVGAEVMETKEKRSDLRPQVLEARLPSHTLGCDWLGVFTLSPSYLLTITVFL